MYRFARKTNNYNKPIIGATDLTCKGCWRMTMPPDVWCIIADMYFSAPLSPLRRWRFETWKGWPWYGGANNVVATNDGGGPVADGHKHRWVYALQGRQLHGQLHRCRRPSAYFGPPVIIRHHRHEVICKNGATAAPFSTTSVSRNINEMGNNGAAKWTFMTWGRPNSSMWWYRKSQGKSNARTNK